MDTSTLDQDLSPGRKEYSLLYSIDNIFHELKSSLLLAKPTDPWGFLYNLIKKKIAVGKDHAAKSIADYIYCDEPIGSSKSLTPPPLSKELTWDTKSIRRYRRRRLRSEGSLSFSHNPDFLGKSCPFRHSHPCTYEAQLPRIHSEGLSPKKSPTVRSTVLNTWMNDVASITSIWSLDIGGTLVKMVILEPMNLSAACSSLRRKLHALKSWESSGFQVVHDKNMQIRLEIGTLHFLLFSSSDFEKAFKFWRENGLLHSGEEITSTGGGSYKYEYLMRRNIKCQLVKVDEFKSLLWGLDFLLRNVPDECYCYETPINPPDNDASLGWPNSNKLYKDFSKTAYPYILCNIGSGVSIIKVMGPNRYDRVSGSCIGGGTFIGLCRLLCGGSILESFTQAKAFQMAKDGDSTNVDFTVADIYGGEYKAFNLAADTVASAFGKVATIPELKDVRSADVASSLLVMTATNIAQLAYLSAVQHELTRIVFCGNFLRHKSNKASRSIARSINYWSKGTMKAYFMKHEGYMGAMGAFVLRNTRQAKPSGKSKSESFTRTNSNN